jgi:lysophospholipase L1-like esterase
MNFLVTPGQLRCLFLSLVVGFAVGLRAEPRNPRWDEATAKIAARELASPSPTGVIVFTGSSSILRWKTLTEDFPHHAVSNRGFGGSQISDIIAYFYRVVVPGNPRQVVIYSGTNDLNAGESPEHVLSDFATLVGMIRVALPETKIAFIGAAPNPTRWAQRAAQERFNAEVAAYCARYGLHYIDVWTPMLGEDGTPSRDIYVADGLHMNAAGYVIWKAVVAPYLVD